MADDEHGTLRVGEYDIPARLARLTGCPFDIFESYGNGQFQNFQKYLHIYPNDSVLEIGCGVGRLAIPATRIIGSAGCYTGIDIIRDSVQWCRENITPRFPNFSFQFEDVRSVYNLGGSIDPATTVISVADASVDKLFLASVFTHMLPSGVDRYLSEFRRVLKPNGIALATVFLLNAATREAIKNGKTSWTFSHRYVDPVGECWFDSPEYPERAVAYDENTLLELFPCHGLHLLQPIIYGSWGGLGDAVADGQDYILFGLKGR